MIIKKANDVPYEDTIGYKKFKKQIFLQTRRDGTNIEQSINYHKFVLEFFTLFLILNPKLTQQGEGKLIGKMYDYLLFSTKPNEKTPLIGDSDDGKVLIMI